MSEQFPDEELQRAREYDAYRSGVLGASDAHAAETESSTAGADYEYEPEGPEESER